MRQKNIEVGFRSQCGAATYSLIILFCLVSCFAIAALAADFAHGVLVRAQVQSACDAAALAGAQDLIAVSGPLTAQQISTVESDAIAIGQQNYADNKSISVTVNNPPPLYNSPPYSSTEPEYIVTATATPQVKNIFAALFGQNNLIIGATSRAGVFPQITTQTVYGNLGQITVPIAIALDVKANNDLDSGQSLSQLSKSQNFKIDLSGATAGGTQSGSWAELVAGNNVSPSSPYATTQTVPTQYAAQSNPGLVTDGSGNSWAYVSGSGNNSATSGGHGWTKYIADQIVANGGSLNMTMLLITDPTGSTQANSLSQGKKLQIVGIVTFALTNTSQGGKDKLSDDPSFYGSLVNALPLSSANLTQFTTFFGQFQGGNNTGNGGQGTSLARLF